jgi:hypothetical protein
MKPEKGPNKAGQPEIKKAKLDEVLADEIYNSIIKIGQEQGLTLADPKFVVKFFGH